jgi:hypothetical protein
MQIDLNKPNSLSAKSVADLLRSKDNSMHRQVRVTVSGILFLPDDVGSSNLSGIKCRFETFTAGGDYTGPNIKEDDHHVKWIVQELSKWPNVPNYIDH